MEALLAFLKLDILIFLVHLEYVEATKLVSRNKGISTGRGQMVRVPETEPQLSAPKESESHKVDVVLNELLTLTVDKGRFASGEWLSCGVSDPALLGQVGHGKSLPPGGMSCSGMERSWWRGSSGLQHLHKLFHGYVTCWCCLSVHFT